ncbi:MAG: hypothetical protein ABFC89_01400, partial [Methanospirillum sp.]
MTTGTVRPPRGTHATPAAADLVDRPPAHSQPRSIPVPLFFEVVTTWGSSDEASVINDRVPGRRWSGIFLRDDTTGDLSRVTPFAIEVLAIHTDEPGRYDLTVRDRATRTAISMEWVTVADAAARLENLGARQPLETVAFCIRVAIEGLVALE